MDVIAYVTAQTIDTVRHEDLNKFNIINIAFGYAKADGAVDVDHITDLSCIKTYKQVNPDLKVFLSVGGGRVSGFSNASFTKERRTRLVETTLEFIRKWGLDGVDMDWEFPTRTDCMDGRPEDYFTYTMLLEDFRAALDKAGEADGKRYQLTMASGADLFMYRSMDVPRVAELLDYIHLMTYDMRWQHMFFEMPPGQPLPTGHHTNLYPMRDDPTGISVERSVNLYLNWGVPREKLLIGAAFYTKRWENVVPENNGLNQPAALPEAHCVGYAELKNRFMTENTMGYKRYWDDEAKAPYLFNGKTFISYDDPESLRHKVQYVKDQGLRGIMFWVYSSDPSGELLDAIDEAIKS